MTKDMLTHSEAKRRLFLLAVSIVLDCVFAAAAVRFTTRIEDAITLIAAFLATLCTFGIWSENIGAARLQYEEQQQQKRSTTND